VDDISLSVASGEFFSLLGPSGFSFAGSSAGSKVAGKGRMTTAGASSSPQ